MSFTDYKSSLPVRTENDGDVVVRISDKTITSQQLAIDSAGNASVTVQNTSSNPVPIQGGNATAVNTSDAADGPVAPGAAASKSSLIGGQYSTALPTLTNGQQAALQADSSGRLLVSQPNPAALKATVLLEDASGTGITSQANGTAHALDVGINVLGVQIDPRQIRALTSADVVTANQGTPNTLANAWPVHPTDGTNSASYTAAGETKVTVTQPLPAGTNIIGSVKLDDGSGNPVTSQANGTQRALDVGINVAGAQIDPRLIRALTATDVVTANIKDSTGTAFSSANPLPVTMKEEPGTEVSSYDQGAATAVGGNTVHTYTVTTGKTLRFKGLNISGSGKGRFQIDISQDGTTFTNLGVLRLTASTNNETFICHEPVDVASAGKVRITKSNLDKGIEDLDSTIFGLEV